MCRFILNHILLYQKLGFFFSVPTNIQNLNTFSSFFCFSSLFCGKIGNSTDQNLKFLDLGFTFKTKSRAYGILKLNHFLQLPTTNLEVLVTTLCSLDNKAILKLTTDWSKDNHSRTSMLGRRGTICNIQCGLPCKV